MAYFEPNSDSAYDIRLSSRPVIELPTAYSIAALRDYLEQCDSRRIEPGTQLFLSAADRLSRVDIVTALPLCINIIRIGTILVFPNGERYGREDLNTNLPVKLVLALATLDETSRDRDAV